MAEWRKELQQRLSSLRLPPAREAEIVQELEQHLEDRYAELIAQGKSDAAACAVVRAEIEKSGTLVRELGMLNPPKSAEVVFGTNGGTMFGNLVQDARYALRMMVKRPLFSLAIIVTLGVCIGAVTAVFSAVDAAILRALPYPEPERLATLVVHVEVRGEPSINIGQDGKAWQTFKPAATLADLAVTYEGAGGVNFTLDDHAMYIRQQRVSAGFFRVLGVPPVIGREFTEEEDRPGGPALAILSNELWRRSFNSNPSIIGQTATIAGAPYEIVGVTAPDFKAQFGTVDVWTPLHPSNQGDGQGVNYEIIGRLRPGVSWAAADAEIRNLGQPLFNGRRFRPGVTARYGLTSLQNSMNDGLRTPLLLILCATVLVLMIGCVNIAGMLLARGAVRSAEIATRMALGAGRGAIIRQLLMENLILGLLASGLGIAIGYLGVQVLKSQNIGWEILEQAQLDWRSLAVTVGASVIATLLFGIFPAWQAGHLDIRSVQMGRGIVGGTRSTLGRILPAFQVAIAVFLLVGAGLLLRSFQHLWTLNPGLDASNVVTATISLRDARYDKQEQVTHLFDETLRHLHQIPGVESAAVAMTLPYERGINSGFQNPSSSDPEAYRISNFVSASPEFFKALRIPLVRGRLFGDNDDVTSSHVIVVNEAFARQNFRDKDALGSQLKIGGSQLWAIIGIVGDTQQKAGWGSFGPMGTVPTVYLPAAQDFSQSDAKWIVRTKAPDGNIERRIEEAVQSVDPLLPIASFQTLQDLKTSAFAWQEFLAATIGLAAALALTLSIIGTYAMISNSVVERTREFGIRMALGATIGQTVRAAAKPGLICAAVGLISGLVAARLEHKLLEGLVWGVTTTDTITFLIVPVAVLIVAGAASIIPALRITRLDPAQTLRQE